MLRPYFLPLRVFLSLLFLFLYLKANAQEKIRIHYKIEDGLFSNTIYSIVQDPKGFVWIATDNGVCRFDGKQFKRYSTLNGLPDNDILSIEVDQQGRIWLATFNKNLCYIYNNSIFTRNNDYKLNKYSFKSYLTLLNLDKSGLIIQEEGRPINYKVDGKGEIKQADSYSQFLSFDDRYIELVEGTLILTNQNNQKVDSLQIPNCRNTNLALMRINTHSFLVSVNEKSYKYRINNNALEFLGEINFQYRNKRFVYSNNELWLYETPNRLVPLDTNLVLIKNRLIEFDNITVNIFFIDKEGGYWIGTKGDGIYYLPKIPVDHYNSKSGLHSNNVIKSTTYNNELYLLLDNNQVQRIVNNSIDPSFSMNLEAVHKGNIKTILANKDYVVCGSDFGYLYIFDRHNASLQTPPKLGGIKYLDNYSNSGVFCATSSNALFLNLKNQKKYNIDSNRSTLIKKINDTTLVVAGINTLRIIKFCLDENQQIKIKTESTLTLKNSTISDIQNTDSLAVMATVESGIYLYSRGAIEHISFANGLTDNNCKSIYIDSENKIWVATSNGINIITLHRSIHDYVIEKISTNHGLTTNNINGIHQIGNAIFASSSKGIFRFPINYLQSEKQSPKVYITEIENFDSQIFPLNNQLTLRSDSVNLKISFSGIDYRSMGNIRYKYRIKEVSDEWYPIDLQTIHIQKLSPGKYRLEILAQNSNNSWSVKPAELRIQVTPLWWQQTVFRVLLVIGGLMLMYALTKSIIQKRYQKKIEEEEMKNHITEVELKAIKAQINPHFIFNTLNAIQYFIQNGENEKADNYLNKMSRLIRTTLNFSNEASIDLAEEIIYLQTYLELETLRFDEDFKYHIENTLPENLLTFRIPTMVLQPHLENAIRHGLKPKLNASKVLHLRFFKEDRFLICQIEDNGIGRKDSKLRKEDGINMHASQGESLSNSKLEIYKRMTGKEVGIFVDDLYTNQHASGTRVTLKIEI